MKKNINAIAIGVIVLISSGYLLINIYKLTINKKESEKTMAKVYELISNNAESNNNEESKENENNEENKDNKNDEEKNENSLILEDGIIGMLIIPKLNITAPIKEGTTQEVMRTSIGHFIESDYWNGNVSFASHNGGTNAHFFKDIYKLQENDEIEYITKLGKKKYVVTKTLKISSTDWSEVLKNSKENNENTITLITCIDNLPNYRLCIKGKERMLN